MDMTDRLALWIAHGFGSGLMPKAPGTWGSLAALFLGLWILSGFGLAMFLIAIISFFILGIWAAETHERIHGRKDCGQVVVDEFVGQWIAMIPLSFIGLSSNLWIDLGVAFAAFRFFDIIKPWPIAWIDRNMTGGMGVMMDDVLAGVMAALSLIGIAWVM